MIILMICTGNSCRSPMAEAILRYKLRQHDLQNIKVNSAGIAAENGYPAHPLSVGVCLEHGIKLNRHRTTHLTTDMLREADVILAMTHAHVHVLSQACPEKTSDIYLLKLYGRDSVPAKMEIADPIGLDHSEYERCFCELDDELERIVQVLRAKTQ